MSYPIASKVRSYQPSTGYDKAKSAKANKGFVPHGLSVILTAPSVFRWTADADPDRHLRAAGLLGANISNAKSGDAGAILADTILTLLDRWRFVPDGLRQVGYEIEDISMLVKGTLPQKKVLDIAPKQPTEEDLHRLFDNSMKLFN